MDDDKTRMVKEFHAILKELDHMPVTLMAGLSKNAMLALQKRGVDVNETKVCLVMIAMLCQCAPGFHNQIANGQLDEAMKALRAAIKIAESMTAKKGERIEVDINIIDLSASMRPVSENN